VDDRFAASTELMSVAFSRALAKIQKRRAKYSMKIYSDPSDSDRFLVIYSRLYNAIIAQ